MKGSLLARRVLTNFGVHIAIITLFFSGLSYYISYTRFQAETEQQLAQFIQSRSLLESDLFIQAQKNVVLVRNTFLRQLEQSKNIPLQEGRFNTVIQPYQDGIWRLRPEYDDHRYKATISIYPNAKMDNAFKQRVLLAYDIVSQFGPAFRLRYHSTFIDLADNDATILYSPDVNYARASLPETPVDENAEVFVYAANHGQKDKVYWTDTYYDYQTAQWLVSVVAPIVAHGHYYGRVGMDVLLSQLIESVNVSSIAGSYNIIIGKNGELIAHPRKMQQIRDAKGQLPINYLQDAELNQIYDTIAQNKTSRDLLRSKDGTLLLGVAPLQGTKWLLVTVYPKKLLQRKAAAAASIVLILGLVTLLIQIFFVARVLKKDVAIPLDTLQNAVDKLAHGQEVPQLNIQRPDEIGALAHGFDLMANAIKCYQDEMDMQVRVRTDALSQRNKALIDDNTELIRLDQEKNTILMIVAHDLKGSISRIKAMAALLRKRVCVWPQEKTAGRLSVVETLSMQSLRLVSNLSDMYTLEEGQYPIKLETVALQPLIYELRQHHQPRLELKRQVMVIQCANIQVQADKSALWQVMDNLISNACRYTPQHGKVELNVIVKDKEIDIVVADQGPGIPVHEFDKLFQKFRKLSVQPAENEYAMGLGLFIAAHLLKLMHGTVRCESQFGHGAKFIVTLPLVTS